MLLDGQENKKLNHKESRGNEYAEGKEGEMGEIKAS